MISYFKFSEIQRLELKMYLLRTVWEHYEKRQQRADDQSAQLAGNLHRGDTTNGTRLVVLSTTSADGKPTKVQVKSRRTNRWGHSLIEVGGAKANQSGMTWKERWWVISRWWWRTLEAAVTGSEDTSVELTPGSQKIVTATLRPPEPPLRFVFDCFHGNAQCQPAAGR